MNNNIKNARLMADRLHRADAHIATEPILYGKLLLAFLLCSLIVIDIKITYEIWASMLRDGSGELSPSAHWSAVIYSVATVGVAVTVLHLVLMRLSARFWNSIFAVLAALVLAGFVLQQTLVVYQETASARAAFEGANGGGFFESLWFYEAQSLARVPVLVAGMFVVAMGSMMFHHALRKLTFVRRLKALRAQYQDLLHKHSKADILGARQDRRKRFRRENIAQQVAREANRIATDVADEIVRYTRGMTTGTAVEEDLAQALLPRDRQPVPDGVRDLAQKIAPDRLNFRALPADSNDLAPQTRDALLDFATWVRATFTTQNIEKELIQ